MDPVTGAALLYGGSQIVGGLISGNSSSNANKTNNKINKRTLKWQAAQNAITREREDNAMQRKAADLEAIGVNPMMAGIAGGQGSPVSQGLGVPAQIPMQKNNVGEIIANSGTNIADSIKKTAETQKVEAETASQILYNEYQKMEQPAKLELLNAQVANYNIGTAKQQEEIQLIVSNIASNDANIMLKEAEKYLVGAKTKTEVETAIKTAKATDLLHEQINLAKQEGRLAENKALKNLYEMIQTEKGAKQAAEELRRAVLHRKMDEITLDWMSTEKGLKLIQGFIPFAGKMGN